MLHPDQRGRPYRGGCDEPGPGPEVGAGGIERTRSRRVSVASTHARIGSLPSHRTATTASPLRTMNRAPRPAALIVRHAVPAVALARPSPIPITPVRVGVAVVGPRGTLAQGRGCQQSKAD